VSRRGTWVWEPCARMARHPSGRPQQGTCLLAPANAARGRRRATVRPAGSHLEEGSAIDL